MLNHYWCKQIYLSVGIVYPTADFLINGYREYATLTKFFIRRANYLVSDEDIKLFEEELISLNDRIEDPLENFIISSSNKISEKVYGIYALKYGVDFEFPTRMLFRSADEFRAHISEVVKGATGQVVGSEVAKQLSDSEIQPILLTESARRFLFQRALIAANSYALWTSPWVLWVACMTICYGVFYAVNATIGPVLALISATIAATSLFLYLKKTLDSLNTLQLDKKVYTINDNYAKGCVEFLQASINFGLLMNRLCKKDRGRPFTLDGNPTDGSVTYSSRMEAVNRHLRDRIQQERKNTLRLLKPTMFTTRLLCQARRFRSQKSFTETVDEWIMSTWGRRTRIGLLTTTVVAYPIGTLLVNGPLLRFTFPKRTETDELPSHLRSLVDEEYNAWKIRENRDEKDAVAKFSVQKQFDDIDSIRAGSMGTRFGTRIALPCFARFTDFQDAQKYCQTKLEPLYVMKKPVGMVWDTKYAEELIDSFVLSENALRFLINRDLFSQDGYQAYANKAISWACFSTFSSLIGYWIHARRVKPTALAFVVIYFIFTGIALYCGNEWHKLYAYMSDMHADSTASRLSIDHCAGGYEYYTKLLKRNRLLRNLLDDGPTIFTPAGDKSGVPTAYLLRYDLLRDARQEFSELEPVIEGDAFASGLLHMSTLVGLAACAVSSMFFGSMFVPVRRFSTGMFVQWVMCSAIFTVGMIVYLYRGMPPFQPLAMLGGFLWSIGNLTAIPIIKSIGLGLGILIWGCVNCTVGWAVGRFGLFGTKASVPTSELMNYMGLVCVIIGGILFSQIKVTEPRKKSTVDDEEAVSGPTPNVVVTTQAEVHAPVPIQEAIVPREVVDGAEQHATGEIEVVDGERTELVNQTQTGVDNTRTGEQDRNSGRLIAILLSFVAGGCYGLTFTPVIYIQDNPQLYPSSPKDAIDYVFSHYAGIYITSITVLIVYLSYKRNQPHVDPQIIGPSLLAGLLWSIAQIAWFIANDSLSQAVTFPINSMVPGVVGTLWSVFYFKEISGRRNIRFLIIAILITLTGAILVGLSKALLQENRFKTRHDELDQVYLTYDRPEEHEPRSIFNSIS
ncbi:hypothetical protein M3Y96_00864700 [Aphelenchoides besseyi]|nr:hypothetical protein M3Y96_00864700 [Aphelenchoides besseyi]